MPDVCAVPTVRIEDDRASVTEWRFAAGAVPGHHRHEYAYVAVHLTTGTLATRGSAGVATASLVAGEPYFRSTGVEHDGVNANAVEFVFVEVELKAS